MLEAGEQQDAILDRLMDTYDVERDCLQRDMQDFFDLLETRGLASASDHGTH